MFSIFIQKFKEGLKMVSAGVLVTVLLCAPIAALIELPDIIGPVPAILVAAILAVVFYATLETLTELILRLE